MSNIQLKPCPFCGGKAILDEDLDCFYSGWKSVHCKNCHAKTDADKDERIAIQNWNNRADDVVSKSAYDRLMWEYETALEQLRVIRLSFAEEPVDDVKQQFLVVRRNVCRKSK